MYYLRLNERPNSKPGYDLDVAYVMTYVEGRALIREISYMEGGKDILRMKALGLGFGKIWLTLLPAYVDCQHYATQCDQQWAQTL